MLCVPHSASFVTAACSTRVPPGKRDTHRGSENSSVVLSVRCGHRQGQPLVRMLGVRWKNLNHHQWSGRAMSWHTSQRACMRGAAVRQGRSLQAAAGEKGEKRMLHPTYPTRRILTSADDCCAAARQLSRPLFKHEACFAGEARPACPLPMH